MCVHLCAVVILIIPSQPHIRRTMVLSDGYGLSPPLYNELFSWSNLNLLQVNSYGIKNVGSSTFSWYKAQLCRTMWPCCLKSIAIGWFISEADNALGTHVSTELLQGLMQKLSLPKLLISLTLFSLCCSFVFQNSERLLCQPPPVVVYKLHWREKKILIANHFTR